MSAYNDHVGTYVEALHAYIYVLVASVYLFFDIPFMCHKWMCNHEPDAMRRTLLDETLDATQPRPSYQLPANAEYDAGSSTTKERLGQSG